MTKDIAVHNAKLRQRIIKTVYEGKDGHIPSALSIVDIINVLYGSFLKVSPETTKSPDRDYFILSKGHGCVAFYSVLLKYGFLKEEDLEKRFCRAGAILGEHPDCLKVPGAEASTGSLGHGFPFAVGIATGLKIQKKMNRVVALLGDGECQEGTIWEAANIACNHQLKNLIAVVDWNGSAAQLQPIDDLPAKWKAFGWNVQVVDGHSDEELSAALQGAVNSPGQSPNVILARTVKGKGLPFLEGHGPWHHKIPNQEEYAMMVEILGGSK